MTLYSTVSSKSVSTTTEVKMKFNITVSQFAERIGRSASYVRAHLAAGTMRIPYLKEGNRVRFCEEDVQDFIDEHTHRPIVTGKL